MSRIVGSIARFMRPKLKRFESLGGPIAPITSVVETTAVTPRASSFGQRRLNILVPSVNMRHYFGGIHTAMQVFEEMAKCFPACRIILTDAAPDAEALHRFASYDPIDSSTDSDASRQIVAFADRYEKTLPVSQHDVWLVTAWWTAYAAQRLADWQRLSFGVAGKLGYIIQDFEPGFYPWSSQSAMALATYRPALDLAIFNTTLLAEYFDAQGLRYEKSVVFEPTINDGLRSALEKMRTTTTQRKKQIVIYARPSTPRNAFALICEALRVWGWSDPRAREWEVLAPGELTEDLDLGPVSLRAMGKLGIQEYSALLSTSAVGLSLMVSPHPSYPPLEMAAFGMGVVTNGFANKDLSSFAPGVRSVGVMSPEALASALARECAEWIDRDMAPYPVLGGDHPFLGTGGFASVAEDGVKAMFGEGLL